MIWTIWNPVIINSEPDFAIKNVALFKKKDWEWLMEYLKFYLSRSDIIQKMMNESRWATQKYVSLKYLRTFKIPVPSLIEQQNIVDEVNVLKLNCDSQVKDIQSQIVHYDELKASILNQAFTGKLVS